ncbi:Glyoxalase Bleomycin resistance dihydroxybiphenyl dioxygenase [Fusarium beomiforme]|uniref:Glyoxalase Bleomycin resistance dihydroxybiphenyl dioxygenase n=1 Tax=Fusarium beomiforme TaxID=44412 RepID=A0A9P5DN06_9HYPO|nr:Glyoxalase Bleomycin resistance dihydroxybiphenyl dioxygenase [Fusarium beomiforme]
MASSNTPQPNFDNPGKTVLKPVKLAHVVLRTNDFQRLSSYYQTFLQAKINFENEFMHLLTYDDEHHRIGIVNMDIANKDPKTCGLEHIAFSYSSLTDLALSYLQRKENGIEPFWCINHGPTTSLYYHDPDGNTLELQVENFDTLEEATEFMKSEAYLTNPLGVDFDMMDLIKRIKSGESEKSLKKRPASGPRGLDTVPA